MKTHSGEKLSCCDNTPLLKRPTSQFGVRPTPPEYHFADTGPSPNNYDGDGESESETGDDKANYDGIGEDDDYTGGD